MVISHVDNEFIAELTKIKELLKQIDNEIDFNNTKIISVIIHWYMTFKEKFNYFKNITPMTERVSVVKIETSDFLTINYYLRQHNSHIDVEDALKSIAKEFIKNKGWKKYHAE